MFFIYLFFGIGVLATLLLALPTIINVVLYFISIFKNFGLEKDNKVEIRKEILNSKKEIKLAKVKEKYGEKIKAVEEKKEEKEVEEVKEEVKEAEHEEVIADEIKHEDEAVAEIKVADETIYPYDIPNEIYHEEN